jgi:hypothetical protein
MCKDAAVVGLYSLVSYGCLVMLSPMALGYRCASVDTRDGALVG